MPRRRRGRRGEGSIEELKGGGFRAVVSAGKDPATGKRLKVSRTFKKREDAQAWIRERLDDVSKGRPVAGGKILLRDWLQKWLKGREGKVGRGSRAINRRLVDHVLIPLLGDLQLGRLTALDVESMYARMRERGESASRQRQAGKALRTALHAAMRHKLLSCNVAAETPLPARETREISPLSAAEAVAFVAACEADPHGTLFLVALDSGARSGELRALHWPEVDFASGSITISRGLEEWEGEVRIKRPKTAKSRRTVLLTPKTMDALRRHREARRKDGRDVDRGLVFLNGKGELVKSGLAHKWFGRICRAAGIHKIRPHDLRHTMASLLLASGVNVKVISERLGHSSITLTLEVYAHLLPGMQGTAVDAMEKILGKKSEKKETVPEPSPDGPETPKPDMPEEGENSGSKTS